MSYSHNKRKKNIHKFVNSALGYVMIDGIKKSFSKVNGVWKLKDYIEPVTLSK
jgi:hypothetical protein